MLKFILSANLIESLTVILPLCNPIKLILCLFFKTFIAPIRYT